MTTVGLNAFVQRAEATNGRTKLDLMGDEVRTCGTNFLSRMFRDMTGDKTMNRNTVSAFVSAVARERGEHAARFIGRSNLLTDVLNQGKPLTSALVRQIMASVDSELANVRTFNQGKIEAFTADAGPGGLRAMIRDRCAALGMPALASASLVESMARQFSLTPANSPWSDAELRGAAEAAVDAALAPYRPVVEQNMRELRHFTALAGHLTKEALAQELETPALIDGVETKVVLAEHFNEEDLRILTEYSLGQARELAEGPDLVEWKDVKGVFTSIMGFSKTPPPNTMLITGMDHHAARAGLANLTPGAVEDMRGLAVLHGIHTEEGLKAGLELAREFSGKIAGLGNISDPAVLLGVLRDISLKAAVPGENAEDLNNIVGFAFKSAMAATFSPPETAGKIFSMLCGDTARGLEAPMGAWAEAANGKQEEQDLSGILGAFTALRTAAREAAGIRRADQPLDAADLRGGVSARFAQIPSALLAKMYMTGCPCGTTESTRGPVMQMFSRMDPESAGMIIKAFQGTDMNGFLVSMAYHDILEKGKEGFSLERMFRDLAGRDLPQPRTPAFSIDLQEALLEHSLRTCLPGVQATNALRDMMNMAVSYLGLSPASVGDLYRAGEGVALASLNSGYMPSLGNHDSLMARHDRLREQVGADFHRRFQRTDAVSVDFGNGVSFDTGPGGAGLPEEYRSTVHEGSLKFNRFAQRVVDEVDALCGPNKAQRAAAYTLFTASAMTFGRGAGEIVRREGMPPFSEHANFSVALSKRADGAVVGVLTAPPDSPYDVTVEYTIAPDGTNAMTGFTMRAR